MSSGNFNKGHDDAVNGRAPSLPTDSSRYDGGNVLLDVFCPGLGLAMAAGTPSSTKQDDAEYMQGYISGSRQS